MADKIINVAIHLRQEAGAPPLSAQIAAAVRQAVAGGTLAAGGRLPPARALARQLGVNPVTVVTAYRHLAASGLVISRVGSGTYVTRRLSGGPAAAAAAPDPAAQLPEESVFPVTVMKRIMTHILDTEGAQAFGYDDVGGYEPLKEALRRLLAEGAVPQEGRDVVIFSGAQQGLSVIVQAFVQRDDWVLVERPTYPGILRLLQRTGAQVACLDLGAAGPDVRALERLLRTRPIRLFYAMPTFQTPTGVSYPPSARRRVLELCRRHGVMIVEDDARSGLDYGNGRRRPLVCDTRPGDSYLYLRSFSHLLMPGFRLAFCLAPAAQAAVLRQAKQESDLATSGFFQRVLYYFLENHYLGEHRRRLETRLKAHFRAALRLVRRDLLPAGFRLVEPDGGGYLWLQLPPGTDTHRFFRACSGRQLQVIPGAEFATDASTSGAFALPVGHLSPAALAATVEVLTALAR